MNLKIVMPRPKRNPDKVKKTCIFCEEEYEVSYQKRKKQKYCSKKCSNADPSVKLKIKKSQKKTYNEKYGCDHPMKTDGVKSKFKKSILEKYGVDHYAKTDEYKEKVKTTCIKRYGVDSYSKTESCKEKTKITNIEKYGVTNPMLNEDISNKVKKSLKGKYFENFLKKCCSKQITFLGDISDYTNNHWKNKYKFKCDKCNIIFHSDVFNFDHLYCEKCDPILKNKYESEIYDFLIKETNNKFDIKRRDRTVLFGKELDFYIPELKIAFEFNGLYWHSENSKKINKKYHLNKTNICSIHGIRLIHIFENEWNYKKDIVKSIIRNILNNHDERIYARKCIVEKISISQKNEFLNENHIQGEDRSSIKLGLFYNKNLVSVMTFRKTSRFDKNVEWELMRFVNKMNTIVVGGASKIFKHFIKNYNPNDIVSYSDKRYFTGCIYNTLNFNFVKNTSPNYYYVSKNYKDLKNRMSFQKHKLKNILETFDPSMTEWQNMQLNGYDRIWDCGNSKWIWIKS